MNIAKILLQPIITEASTLQTEKNNQYIFKVVPKATKPQIAEAVSEMYNVTVLSVRTCQVKRQARRQGRRAGFTSSWKKAFVTLKSGQKIDFVKGS